MTQGAGESVPLTRGSVEITSLVFTHTVGMHTQAVRIEMTAQRHVKDRVIAKDFRTFAVLDAS
jgi:hypothetical protein